jgi:hypothetical protein
VTARVGGAGAARGKVSPGEQQTGAVGRVVWQQQTRGQAAAVKVEEVEAVTIDLWLEQQQKQYEGLARVGGELGASGGPTTAAQAQQTSAAGRVTQGQQTRGTRQR